MDDDIVFLAEERLDSRGEARLGAVWYWKCPLNHCPYSAKDSFRFIVRFRRWLHITMKV